MCSVKCALGSLAVLAIYSTLVGSWGLSHRLEPCEAAKDAQVRLQKLRLAGRPEGADLFPSDWEAKLPKIIHHQWKTSEIPEKYKEWNEKWFDLFPEPEYTHMMWTDDSGRALIKEHYPWFLETYDNYDYSIKRADAVRYFFLYHYGGLHADLDYEPLVNFYKHLPQDRVGLVESPYQYNEATQNSLMTSPKGDPFWRFIFTELIEKKDKPVLKATGPTMLGRAVQRTNHPIHVLPCENFQRIPFGESGVSPLLTFLLRELLGRLYPMKQCGAFNDEKCHFAKHHNTAVYMSDTGVLNLLP